MSNFMKSRPVGAQLFHVEGRRDRTKLIFALRNSANAPYICVCIRVYVYAYIYKHTHTHGHIYEYTYYEDTNAIEV
jgi:hypothetical protein